MRRHVVRKILLVLIVALFLNVTIVNAENCDALLTQDAAQFIEEIVGFIRIAVPILLIVLCSSDFVSVIVSQADNAMKKAVGRIVKRFIAAAAFFFVPLIVQVLLGIDAIKNSLNLVDDPTCGIGTEDVGQ